MILDMGQAPFWFCPPSVASAGGEFRAKYIAAKPIPHIVLDDFLPRELAELCVCEFPVSSLAQIQYAGDGFTISDGQSFPVWPVWVCRRMWPIRS